MVEIGYIFEKIRGRDKGKLAVIVEIIDDNYVLIDGEVRRRKCNIRHLIPTGQKVNIKKGASREEVKKAFKEELNIELRDTNPKPNKEKPKSKRVLKMEENIKRKAELAKKKKDKSEKSVKKENNKKEQKDNKVKKDA